MFGNIRKKTIKMEYQALAYARLRLISFAILAQKITEPGRTGISIK
ncbi:hypothetical protein ACM6Q7_01425 [Peribacillus butanolivorans]